MPKVFIIQEPLLDKTGIRPPKDLSSLESYGDIVFLLHKFDRGTDNPNRVLTILKMRLKEFDPSRDYLLNLGSDPVSSLLAGMVLSGLGPLQLTFLKWEKRRNEDGTLSRDGFYVPVKLILAQ